MKWPVVLLLVVSTCSAASAQVHKVFPTEVRAIKLLESTRGNVKQLLKGYESSDDDEYEQEFTKDELTITVIYSRGTCTAESDDEDASEVWNVGEGRVTRIEISLDEPVKLKDSGLLLSRFRKEPRYPEDIESLVFHDKAAGLAVKTDEEGIEKIIVFPSLSNKARLCRNSTAAKGFYTRKGWFSQAKPYDFICELINRFANVNEVTLGDIEVDAAGTTTVSVVTIATDPENDILTYNYTVSAGKIIGTGYQVIWDLTGAAPGEHKIIAGVDDGAGVVGTTVTKTVVRK